MVKQGCQSFRVELEKKDYQELKANAKREQRTMTKVIRELILFYNDSKR